jgi:hypothetical protein
VWAEAVEVDFPSAPQLVWKWAPQHLWSGLARPRWFRLLAVVHLCLLGRLVMMSSSLATRRARSWKRSVSEAKRKRPYPGLATPTPA